MTQATAPLHVVDEEDQGLGKPLPVRHSRIVAFEGQPRRWFDDASIEELADDMEEEERLNPGTNGQKTPVRVCKYSTKPGFFVLIGGERRWRAIGVRCKRTGKDLIINCFIDVVHDERHHFREAFLDNIRREDLIPADEAAGYKRLYRDSKELTHRAKVLSIARMVGKSETHVENYLALDGLPDEVKLLMHPERPREQRLNVTSAVDIARSTSDPRLQRELALEAIERNLDTTETRMLISIKTGKSGYGVGGRLRKPSDDYKAFKIFLGGVDNRLRRLTAFHGGLDFDALYESRPDEFGDRERDAAILRNVIANLKDVLEKVQKGLEAPLR